MKHTLLDTLKMQRSSYNVKEPHASSHLAKQPGLDVRDSLGSQATEWWHVNIDVKRKWSHAELGQLGGNFQEIRFVLNSSLSFWDEEWISLSPLAFMASNTRSKWTRSKLESARLPSRLTEFQGNMIFDHLRSNQKLLVYKIVVAFHCNLQIVIFPFGKLKLSSYKYFALLA